jgi:dienelactone hydrolase
MHRGVHAPLSLHFGADDPLTLKREVDAITASLCHRGDAEICPYRRNFALLGVPDYDQAIAELAERRAFTRFDHLKKKWPALTPRSSPLPLAAARDEPHSPHVPPD